VAKSWELDFQTDDDVELGRSSPPTAGDRLAPEAPLATWAEEAGFESAQDLALELVRAARVRRAEYGRPRGARWALLARTSMTRPLRVPGRVRALDR